MNFDEMLDELYCCQEVKLTKKEKSILKALKENENCEYYDLLDLLDYKPSKFNKHLEFLVCCGFVDFKEDDTLSITEEGEKFLAMSKKEKKDNKKLLKFIESLSEDEIEEFKKTFEEVSDEDCCCCCDDGKDECCCCGDDKDECCCEDECCCNDDSKECCCKETEDNCCCCKD